MRDTDQNKRREELQKRIEDTRRKLQNIGYQSMLRGSQSISDLTSHLPDKYKQQSASRPDSAMSDYHTHVTNRSCKYTVKLGDKEHFDKEQIGFKEPFPMTKCQFTS